MRKFRTVAPAAGLLLALVLFSFSIHADAKEAPDANGDFVGKVLVVSCRSDGETGAILRDFGVRTFADKKFLVGITVEHDDPAYWTSGRTVWIAVDDIAQIVEFDSVEQYRSVRGG